jgi:hypothetical protein
MSGRSLAAGPEADVATQAERRTYLDGLADRGLDALAQEQAERDALARAEEEAAARRKRARAEIAILTAERDKALSLAEGHCRQMVAAMKSVVDLGPRLVALHGEALLPLPANVAGPSAARHLSGCLSAALRGIAGNSERFGAIRLGRTWRSGNQPWTEEGTARRKESDP